MECMNKKYKTIALACVLLQLIIIVINYVAIDIYDSFDSNSIYLSFSITADFIIFFAFITSFFNYEVARLLQPLILIMKGFLSFILIGFSFFFGWGLFFLGLILGYKYGILKQYPRIKVGLILISYICVIVFRTIGYLGSLSSLLEGSVYMAFIIFFICVLYHNQVEAFLGLRKDYRAIAEDLVDKQNVVFDLEEQLENAETGLLRLSIETEVKEVNKAIKEDFDSIQQKIRAIPGFARLSDIDLQMLVYFYIARGDKTNKELAFDIGKDENYVKNHLRMIYSTFPNINTRAGLLVYITDYLG